jgi:hypothetical protein
VGVLNARVVVDMNLGARLGDEGLISADVVGVNMALKDVGDAKSLLPGRREIAPDVPLRVNDRALAHAGTAHHVGTTPQPLDEELSKEHPFLPLAIRPPDLR